MPLPTTRANVIRLYKMNFLNENTSFSWHTNQELIENLDRECYGTPVQIQTFNLIQDKDEIRVYMSYDDALKYDYMLIGYYDDELNVQKWLCCYITDVRIINVETMAFKVKIDTFTTFYNEFNVMGLLERVHSPRYTLLQNSNPNYFMVSKDLYFAEDEPSVNYKPQIKNTLFANVDYVVITLSIPLSAIKPSTITYGGNTYNRHYYEDTITQNKLYDIVLTTNGVVLLDNLFKTKGMFGNTTLTTLIVSVVSQAKQEPNTNVNYTSQTYEEFLENFPSLKDKIVSSAMLPPIYDNTNFEKCCVVCPSNGLPILTSNDKAILYVEDVNELTKSVNSTSKLTDFQNNYTFTSHTNIYVKYYDEEPKLKLYPYSYYKIHMYSDELNFKYQDLKVENQNDYGTIKCFIDIFSSSISALFVKTYDKYDSASTTRYDKISLTCVSLPTMSVFDDQYDQYRNYQKAMVDTNLMFSGLNTALNVGVDVASAVATGGMATMAPKVIKSASSVLSKTSYELSSQKSGAGAVGSVVGFMQDITQAKLNELMLKRKPTIERGQMTNQATYFVDWGDSNNPQMKAHIYYMTLNENELYQTYNKFYYYGYYTPVVVNCNNIAFGTTSYFEVLFESRERFNFVKFSNCLVQGNFASAYQRDIEQRLINGITIFHSASDRPIEYDNYGVLYNCEVLKYRSLTKPLFAKE